MEVGLALTWCADNKARLKKSKSKFEFQLRLQEFIELVRAENYMRAIMYARKYKVRFHTLYPEIFASGSLDHEVRLWNAIN